MQHNNKQTYLVTGTAGFIGYHTAKKLLARGDKVVGYDNVCDYYDVNLKEARLKQLADEPNYTFIRADLCDYQSLRSVFEDHQIDKVCNLAAQAGVRYSLENPFAYQKANLEGFLNILDLSKEFKVAKFVYASSSSVYGGNTKIPFSTSDDVSRPVSLYAATKRANELIAYTYHHLYQLPSVGLRFFTVYGPWGRPDMALFIFTKAILEGRPIQLYNFGKMKRDFTYIDDIVAGIIASLDRDFSFELFNLGNSNTVELTDFVKTIEDKLGQQAIIEKVPIQPGDVPETFADIADSRAKLEFTPKVDIAEGIGRFIDWYRGYYSV
jgi:UDP-glucuronate 4-epimerase